MEENQLKIKECQICRCGIEKVVLFPRACSDLELHTMCAGCPRIKWDQICSVYLEPRRLWGLFKACPMKPRREIIKEEFKNPMKASMRKAAGK
jgi:hypothetical protein